MICQTNILLSGPAGANKSAEARRLLAEHPALAVVADFQSIYAALTLAQRDPSGRYPLRDERLLPIVEYLRRAVFSAAQDRGISVIATNSDGNRGRRAFWLSSWGLMEQKGSSILAKRLFGLGSLTR